MTRLQRHAGALCAALSATAVASVALAGGGYSGVALGAAAAIVWSLLLIGLLSGRLGDTEPQPGFVVASAFLAALLCITVASMGWTSSDDAAFGEVVRLAGYLGVFLLAGLAARRRWIGPVLAGLAAAGVFVALVALGSRLLGLGAGDARLVADLPTAGGRLSFPIGYWNAVGALMALSVPPLCWAATTASSTRLRSLALAGFAPLLLAGYLTSSRGAVLAVALGLAVTVSYSPQRRAAAAAAAIGVATAVPSIVAATLASGLIDTPGTGSPGRSELVVLAALAAGVAFALVLGRRLIASLARSRPFSIVLPARVVIAGLLAAATILIALAGPAALIGDLREGTQSGDERTTGIVSASGSGRAQFWSTAVGAFASEPARGIGAGGFEDYWNRNGAIATPARNAHSEPLEILAELGLVGFVCFAGFIAVVLACAAGRARRAPPAEGAGAAFGLIVAGLFSFAIDWTWQVPAVVAPVLIAAGMTVGLATAPVPLPRLAPRTVALAAIVIAIPAIWASGVLAFTTSRLQASDDALARGQLNEAASAARSAAALQPWASGPWLQIADIEQAGGNLDAAQAAVAAAIERDPESLQAWVRASNVLLQRGNRAGGAVYGLRALELRPTK